MHQEVQGVCAVSRLVLRVQQYIVAGRFLCLLLLLFASPFFVVIFNVVFEVSL
jgi:hypothetical protein